MSRIKDSMETTIIICTTTTTTGSQSAAAADDDDDDDDDDGDDYNKVWISFQEGGIIEVVTYCMEKVFITGSAAVTETLDRLNLARHPSESRVSG